MTKLHTTSEATRPRIEDAFTASLRPVWARFDSEACQHEKGVYHGVCVFEDDGGYLAVRFWCSNYENEAFFRSGAWRARWCLNGARYLSKKFTRLADAKRSAQQL